MVRYLMSNTDTASTGLIIIPCQHIVSVSDMIWRDIGGRDREEEESTSVKVDFSGEENQAAEKHDAGDIRVFTRFSPFCS